MIKDFLLKFSYDDKLTAIRTTNKTISYKQLFENSILLARSLNKILTDSDKFIPVLISNSIEFIETILAIWNLGKCPVPFNLKWTSEEISEIISYYKFNLILYEKRYLEKLEDINVTKIDIGILSKESISLPFFENDLEKNALVIFTSGSGNKPKGVVHSFNSLINSVLNAQEILNLKPKERILASLPLYHIGGFQLITRALLNGCEILIPNSLDISSISEVINKFNTNHLSLVSTQLKRLIDIGFIPNNNLKTTLVGGGFIEDELIISATAKGWNPLRVYGSSETCSFITAANSENIIKKPNTVGKPLKNCKIKISSEGEILISSNSLFKGYLTTDAKVEKVFVDNFYPSGDIGYLDDDGYLFIEAKRTDLITTGGENVNPIEVENLLLKINGVKEVCVFPKPDKEWGQLVAAAIVVEKKISEEEIMKYLKDKLSGYKIPKIFYFADYLPKTSIDKIDRRKVIEKYNRLSQF